MAAKPVAQAVDRRGDPAAPTDATGAWGADRSARAFGAAPGDDPLNWDYRQLADAMGWRHGGAPAHRQLREKVTITSGRLREALRVIAGKVLANARTASRDHTAEMRAKITANVDLVVVNLLAAATVNDEVAVALPSQDKWYSNKKEPRSPILSRAATVQAVRDGLIRLGMAEIVRKGSPMGGTHTLIRATPALLDRLRHAEVEDAPPFILEQHHDPIVLKAPKKGGGPGADGKPRRFDETPETLAMRERLTIINAANRPGRVTLGGLTPDDLDVLLTRLHEAKQDSRGRRSRHATAAPTAAGIAAWLNETQFYRIFNNGNFDEGGRFYGAGWQLIPEKEAGLRKHLRIDGERVSELDFKACAARMTFHVLAKIEAPEDPYRLMPAPRSFAKTAFNAMLNKTDGLRRPYRGYDAVAAGVSWLALVDATLAAMPAIAKHLGTGVGLSLQRRDSDVAEAVMLHFAKKDIPCLGIHDSFLVQQRYRDELRAVMLAAYRDQTGFEAIVTG